MKASPLPKADDRPVKLTSQMSAWLFQYRDGQQNGASYPVDSVWTRGKGTSFPGIAQCRSAGLITSHPDATLRKGGWRHDITPAGRSALAQHQGGEQ